MLRRADPRLVASLGFYAVAGHPGAAALLVGLVALTWWMGPRLQGGPRKITSITEVLGMEQDVIIMQDIFKFKQLGIDQNGRSHGQFEATGVRPAFVPRLESTGIKLPSNLFQERVLMRD